MKTSDFTTARAVDQTPEEVFNAINSVSKWWKEIEGSSQKSDDVFTIHFGKALIPHKIAEPDPNKKVVWHVTDRFINENLVELIAKGKGVPAWKNKNSKYKYENLLSK